MEVLMEVPMEVDVAESPADLRNQARTCPRECVGALAVRPLGGRGRI
jgi:hypothetical protein